MIRYRGHELEQTHEGERVLFLRCRKCGGTVRLHIGVLNTCAGIAEKLQKASGRVPKCKGGRRGKGARKVS